MGAAANATAVSRVRAAVDASHVYSRATKLMAIAACVRRHDWGAAVAAVMCAEGAQVGAKDCPIISLMMDSSDVAQLCPTAASGTLNPALIYQRELTGQHPTNEVGELLAIASVHRLQHSATGDELGFRQPVGPVLVLRVGTCDGVAFPARAVGYRRPNPSAGARGGTDAPGLAHTPFHTTATRNHP